MSLRRILKCLAIAVWLAGVVFLARVWAHTPIPITFLLNGDLVMLISPVPEFRRELERIKPPFVPPFRALPPREDLPLQNIRDYRWVSPGETPKDHSQQTAEADYSDLRAALEEMNLSEKQREALLAQHRTLRGSLRSYALAALVNRFFRTDGFDLAEEGPGPELPTVSPRPRPELLKVPEGLPGEFADYLRGAIAYYRGPMDEARAAWQAVLDRPASQRRYRSTWAAFMLGRSLLRSDPTQAVVWFERVRDLAQQGFVDSLGLAAASLGWQARAELDRTRERYSRAMELYLAQSATGDPTAEASLIRVARKVFDAGPEALRQAATNPTAQRVITGYVITHGGPPWDGSPPSTPLVKAWLYAVEANRVTDMEGAERVAWAAYQVGELETARRWLDRAPPDAAMTLWLRAKLLLHDGRIDEAVPLLARVTRLFPPSERWWSVRYGPEVYYLHGLALVSPAHRAVGELGVLHLTRRAYTEALDALLRAGLWIDAAYVAERVLTPDELIAYVDRHWPQPTQAAPEREGSTARSPEESGQGGEIEAFSEEPFVWEEMAPMSSAASLRHLLARRLARIGRWKEAGGYWPPELRPHFDTYVRAMRAGRDRKIPAEKQAEALWQAARIARYDGMELLGTEIEPDWRALDGNYELLPISLVRGSPVDGLILMRIMQSSQDERDRLRRHIHPQKRFHYRYTAADLAWEGAALMPDQSEATARVLCIAGSWLKYRDPKAADRFYKALVKRCGKTELGREADRLRWFPVIR